MSTSVTHIRRFGEPERLEEGTPGNDFRGSGSVETPALQSINRDIAITSIEAGMQIS